MLKLAGIAVWLSAVAAGMGALYQHEYLTGAAGESIAQWPADASPLALRDDRVTMLFFAHPLCPCTRNSLAELRRFLDRHPSVEVHAIVTVPTEGDESWNSSPLVSDLRSDPRFQVSNDPAGKLAERFGAASSGTLMVYGPNGALRYRGGITSARSHQGSGPGLTELKRVVDGLVSSGTVEYPVFGCDLVRARP